MNLRYKFWLPQQLLVGVIPFASAVGIPYPVGDPIDWLMVGTVTVSVFLASGVRFCRETAQMSHGRYPRPRLRTDSHAGLPHYTKNSKDSQSTFVI
jgi:hypothetical protein